MNFYKITAGLSLALMLSSGFSGCGGSSSGNNEPEGFVNQTVKTVAKADGVIAKDKEEVIVLKDDKGETVAKVVLANNTELRDSKGNNKCACKPSTKCTPCAVTVTRSCGSKAVDTAQKTQEVQDELDGTMLALLSASYTIKINRPTNDGDKYDPAIKVQVKVPKCVHDKTTDTYFDYKDGEVLGIRIWVQTGDSSGDGYWLKDGNGDSSGNGDGSLAKTFTLEEIKSGILTFLINKPNVTITLIGIVKNPSATGATGTGGA